MPTLSPVRVTGDPDNRVNIIFAGDGYRATEIESVYKTHVDNATNYFFGNALAEPFGRYDGFFNVYRANVVSTQSGTDIPPENIFRNTALDASYYWDGATERLLYVDDAKTDSAVAGALAGTSVMPDMVFVSVNATKYGGGGGTYAVFAGGNSDARELALHEVGHSFAGLADEYFDPGTFYNGPELPQPNVTIDPTGAKWAQWIGYYQLGIGEIGAYEGGHYHEFGVYRPSLNSKMQTLGNPFDAVRPRAVHPGLLWKGRPDRRPYTELGPGQRNGFGVRRSRRRRRDQYPLVRRREGRCRRHRHFLRSLGQRLRAWQLRRDGPRL
jgi:hypothetical protein